MGVDKVKPKVWVRYSLYVDWHFNKGPKRKNGTTPCPSSHCPPGLETPSQHSRVLGPSIWTIYAHSDPLNVIGWMAQPANPMFSFSLSTWTQMYSGLLSEPCTTTQTHEKVKGWMAQLLYSGTAGYMVVAHKISVSAQGPLVLVLRLRVWGQGLTIALISCSRPPNSPKWL